MKDAIWKYYWMIFTGILPVLIVLSLRDNFIFVNYLKALLFVITFPLAVAVLMACLSVKIFGKYYPNLNVKTASLFNARIKSSHLSKAKVGKYDLYIQINEESQ